MRKPTFKQFLPAIGWFILVMILICLPGQDYPETNGWSAFLKKIWFDKWVHAGLFGVLSFLISYPILQSELERKTRLFLIIAVGCSVWGLTTEYIQLLVPGRDFDWLDWAADSFGACIAYLVLLKWLKVKSS